MMTPFNSFLRMIHVCRGAVAQLHTVVSPGFRCTVPTVSKATLKVWELLALADGMLDDLKRMSVDQDRGGTSEGVKHLSYLNAVNRRDFWVVVVNANTTRN